MVIQSFISKLLKMTNSSRFVCCVTFGALSFFALADNIVIDTSRQEPASLVVAGPPWPY